MLRSFGVKNFRCLQDLEVHNLARLNLIVGDNDTGKTALIEAVFAHLIQASPIHIVRLKEFRRTLSDPDDSFWSEFFTAFDDLNEIHLWSVDSENLERNSKLSVVRSAQVSVIAPTASGANLEASIRVPSQTSSFRPLHVEYKSGKMDHPVSNDLMFDAEKKALIQAKSFAVDLPAYFFSTGGPPATETIAEHLSKLMLNKQDADLLGLVQKLDERVRSLSVASPKGRSEVFIDIGGPHLVPLTLFGSGVLRAVAMACAIPSFAGGILLVDEIENGVYFGRMAELWRGLFAFAQRFDVQLIASTHSSECIRSAVENVTPDLKDADPIHVYRLVRGRKTPVPYDRENLQAVVEFMAEVR